MALLRRSRVADDQPSIYGRRPPNADGLGRQELTSLDLEKSTSNELFLPVYVIIG